MNSIGSSSVSCSSRRASSTRLSRSVPGTTMPFRPLNWLDSRLYQVTPRDWPKYFGFGPAWMALAGVDGTRRRGEAHAVRRRDVPRAPDFAERQCGMGRHDPRIGGRDGFRSDEILADPGQTLPPERRNILPADRLDADIAGF